MSLNAQMIDNQIYLINSTKNTVCSPFTTGTFVLGIYPVSLLARAPDFEWPCYPSVFCISFPRLAQCLVHSIFLTFTTAVSQVPFEKGRRPL